MIGRFVDVLAEREEWAAIDRVIVGQNWTTDWVENKGAHCFLGFAEGWFAGELYCEAGQVADFAPEIERLGWSWDGLGNRFDRLVYRFGMERVVRAIKNRCGKHTRVATGFGVDVHVNCEA